MQEIKTTTPATAAAEIVYMVAPSGTGKTFTGDYLALMQGYHHVDGDCPLKNKHLPQYSDMAAKWWKNCTVYMKNNEDGLDELWQPYFAELARQALAAAETSDRVVLTHATYRQKYRDFLLGKLEEGAAANGKTVTVVTLAIDEDVKLRGLFPRFKKWIEAGGAKLEDYMKETYEWEGDGEFNASDYVDFCKHHPRAPLSAAIFEDVPYGKVVDCSSRDMSTLDAIDEALGLGKRSGDFSYEEICKMVRAVEAKRDEEFNKNVDLKKLMNSNKEGTSASEEKVASSEDESPVPNATERRSSSSIEVSS